MTLEVEGKVYHLQPLMAFGGEKFTIAIECLKGTNTRSVPRGAPV